MNKKAKSPKNKYIFQILCLILVIMKPSQTAHLVGPGPPVENPCYILHTVAFN